MKKAKISIKMKVSKKIMKITKFRVSLREFNT